MPYVTHWTDTIQVPPGGNAIPHGLDYDGQPWDPQSMIVQVSEVVDQNILGTNVVDVVGWDGQDVLLGNTGGNPQTCTIEAVGFFPMLALYVGNPAFANHENMQQGAYVPIAPGVAVPEPVLLRDNGAGVPPLFACYKRSGIGGAGGDWARVDLSAAELIVEAAAAAPMDLEVGWFSFHSIQRAIASLGGDSVLLARSGPFTLAGGEQVLIPNPLVVNGAAVFPDMVSHLVVGGDVEGNPLFAPVNLYRTQSDIAATRYENQHVPGPGTEVTFYVYHLHLHSITRYPEWP